MAGLSLRSIRGIRFPDAEEIPLRIAADQKPAEMGIFIEGRRVSGILQPPRFLDVLTVYRDRRDYPHKLCNAIEAYGLGEYAVNSHRAVDDARATVLLLEAMAAERDDLDRYLDLFGTHPRYGLSGRRISSVTYRPQPYQRTVPLYELP